MDTRQIIDALQEERGRLDRALAVLEGNQPAPKVRKHGAVLMGARKGPRHMSKEARDRIAAAQRRRWAKVKAKQAAASGGKGKKK